LGRNAIVNLPLAFFGVSFDDDDAAPLSLFSVLSFVEPHATSANASAGTSANFEMDMSLLTGMVIGR
jgi:hypothetical protein